MVVKRGSKVTVMPIYWGETTLHPLSLRAYQLNFILISETLIWICCNKAFCQVPPHPGQCGSFYIWNNSKTWWDEKEVISISYKLVSEEFWHFSLNRFTTGHLNGLGHGITPPWEEWAEGFCFWTMKSAVPASYCSYQKRCRPALVLMCLQSGTSKGRNKVLHSLSEWWTHFEAI